MKRLEGRIAVVTGGSRGIGAAIAAAFSADGARVVISGRTESTLSDTAERIGAIPVVADAADRDSAREPVRAAIDRLGGIDILVNNVGGTAGGNPDLFQGTDAAFEQTLTLSLTSAFSAGLIGWMIVNSLREVKEEAGLGQSPLLVVYGGAGAAHCCDVARAAGLVEKQASGPGR